MGRSSSWSGGQDSGAVLFPGSAPLSVTCRGWEQGDQ